MIILFSRKKMDDYRFRMDIDLNELGHFVIYIESKEYLNQINDCLCYTNERFKITVYEMEHYNETVVFEEITPCI